MNLVGMPDQELRRFRGPDLGLIFQEPMTRLNPLMRIEQHFAETLKQHEPGLNGEGPPRGRSRRSGRWGSRRRGSSQYPHEFSGGMRQRIMIALALVLRPKLLIADEPTTSLDVIVEAQILSILADLRQNFGTALLLITHNLGIVAEACDRVAVMYAGQIVEEGDARDVFSEPAHPYTRELLRSTISLDTTELHSIPGAPPNLIAPPTVVGSIRAAPTRCRSAPARVPTQEDFEEAAGACFAGSTVAEAKRRLRGSGRWNASSSLWPRKRSR